MDFQIQDHFTDDLENEWNLLLDQTESHVPFLRYEYLRVWWETRGGGEWPGDIQLVLVTARRDGLLVGGAPLFLSKDRSGEPALFLVGSIEVSDFLDLLAAPADLDEFCTGLLKFLSNSGLPAWKRLDLYNLLDSSPTLNALEKAAGWMGWQTAREKLQHSPYIPLPGDWETYLAGIDKKQRHEIRRKMRRAEEAELPVSWYFAGDPARLDEEIDDFITLMKFEEDKDKFLTPAMQDHFRRIVRCAFEKDCLFMAFLTINGEKAAGYIGFDYLNRLWVYNSGMNPGFRDYSPGWVMLGYQIQWAIQHGYREFDFMRGDEEYKYRFGAVDRFVMRITLTRPA